MKNRLFAIGTATAVVAAITIYAAGSHDTGDNSAHPVEPTPVAQCLKPITPQGTGRGIFPGRVVWSHAPGAAQWNGRDGAWFDDDCNDQEYCDWLVRETLCSLTGCNDPHAAWQAIFEHYNYTRHGAKGQGYHPTERIAVKINNNNTSSHADSREINASPHLTLALLRSMIRDGGIPEPMISVAEPSRYITDFLFDKCHTEFPGVTFVDHSGGNGRTKTEYRPEAMHYSADNGRLARGIATVFTDADYIIDMAILKGHVGQGVTLCGKNWYGAMSIDADWRRNTHDNFNQSRDGRPKYVTFVDFMGHSDLGGKTVLWLIDALYGCRAVGGAPQPRWDMPPFDNEWPCSLLGSLDPVAIDMVATDLLINQFPDMPDLAYSDMYLLEAALAGNPPSGTRYDPDGSGRGLGSLGVAEHWNNPRDKQYSRNLGREEGIELLYRRH